MIIAFHRPEYIFCIVDQYMLKCYIKIRKAYTNFNKEFI